MKTENSVTTYYFFSQKCCDFLAERNKLGLSWEKHRKTFIDGIEYTECRGKPTPSGVWDDWELVSTQENGCEYVTIGGYY